MQQKSKRNGKIELLRFIFCILILFFHCDVDMFEVSKNFNHGFSFFRHGYVGVEFFFIVTGYLMVKSSLSKRRVNTPIGKDTVNFLAGKVTAIMPAHIPAFLVTFIVICFDEKLTGSGILKRLLDALPNFFFVSRTGLPYKDVIGVEWYISTMMVALLILYPLLKRFKKTFTMVIAPIISIFIIGYICHKYDDAFSGVKAWDVFCTKSTLRAIAIISLGAFCYSFAERIKQWKLKKSDIVFLTVLEAVCYILIFYYAVSQLGLKYDGIFAFIMALAVSLSFSEVTLTSKLFNNNLCYYLGKLSLPIYLCQDMFRKIVNHNYSDLRGLYKVIMFVGLTVIAGIILELISRPVTKAIQRKIKQITS